MADSWPQQMPEQTVPEQTVPEQTVPEQTVPEQTVPEQTVAAHARAFDVRMVGDVTRLMTTSGYPSPRRC
jgi:hypothetical protein